jgi:uncharacterized membrane protein
MRKTRAVLASTVAAAGIVAGSLATASASSATPAASGTEHFYLMTTSGTATTEPVIATGVFTTSGVDHTGNKIDKVVVGGGTFKINHSGSETGAPKVNTKTCFVTFSGSSKFTVGGGTGTYKGISGSGKAVISIVGILGRTSGGACSDNAKPVAWQQTIRGTAHVTL